MYNYVSKASFCKDAKIIHREILFKKKIELKLSGKYSLGKFQWENAESLPDLFQKIIRSSQCQGILSTHIVSGNRNLNAVISALCISHCEILQNIF